ncbi:SGNH/GDSL hydrolase family protein [Trinickia mobilis]|uniref:SGNH/GDSL hydrolase family protein n=1 Tax=Trinickia mobilis TaxID=2816356 RepID=UPI001A8CC326|nr:SGNH/GDSL hydrolase family protein [Trinickia mobilis]
MKQSKKTQPKSLLRVAQTAAACAALALLAACGGGGSSSSSTSSSTPPGGVSLLVVSFGDSLSDVGTYSPVILPSFGGGKFTTNPGQIWVQDIANYYGGTVTPAYLGGFGQPLTASTGLGYGQGGARVNQTPGIGTPQATAMPISWQVQQYLSAHGSFNSNQLVVIEGGPNDVLLAAAAIAANPTNPTVIAQQEANVVNAAVALAGIVGQIIQNGATKVVLANLPDIGKTPQGISSSDGGALLTSLSAGFNTALSTALTAGGLANSSSLIQLNTFQFIDSAVANYASNGFSVSNTGTACNLQAMVTNATAYAEQNPSVLSPGETAAEFGTAFGQSLFCSPQTLTVAGADQTYMFADTIHPTTHLHALFAQAVEQTLAAKGIGH